MATTTLPPYPLKLTTLSTPLLISSPHLPTLYTLINHAFTHSHKTGHRTILLTEQRLQGPAQLVEEIGPEGFCILAFSIPDAEKFGEESRLIGTASAKPYHAPGTGEGMEGSREGGGMMSDVNRMFKRPEPVLPIPPKPTTNASSHMEEEDGEEKWGKDIPSYEILAMAVSPELQGRGIASQLLDATVRTIRERVRETNLSALEAGIGEGGGAGGEKGGRVKILLSTLKELKEEYYVRKGWKSTHERRFPAGVGGSEEGFGVVDMIRIVSLDEQ